MNTGCSVCDLNCQPPSASSTHSLIKSAISIGGFVCGAGGGYGGPVEADNAEHFRARSIARLDEQIIDEMPRGLHAADSGKSLAFTPGIKFSDSITTFEAVVTNRHDAVRRIKLVCVPTAIAIHLVPISRL